MSESRDILVSGSKSGYRCQGTASRGWRRKRRLVSIKVNLEKQQKEIKSLDQQLAQMLEADAVGKEILYRRVCEFEVSLLETIALILLHCNQGTIKLWYC